MVSTQRRSAAERVASNAWLWGHGGCIFADALNAGTSAAVILRQISMHRNTTPLRATRSSRASSRVRNGSTTIVPRNFSPARSSTLLTRIRQNNRCRGRLEQCLQTGNRYCTNRGRLSSGAASHALRSLCSGAWILYHSKLDPAKVRLPVHARRSTGKLSARPSGLDSVASRPTFRTLDVGVIRRV
jgi:hypothetical protein